MTSRFDALTLDQEFAILGSTVRTYDLTHSGDSLAFAARMSTVVEDCSDRARITWARTGTELVRKRGFLGFSKLVETVTYEVRVEASNEHFHRMANLRLTAMLYALQAQGL